MPITMYKAKMISMLTAEGAKRSNVGLSSAVSNSASVANSDNVADDFGLSVYTQRYHCDSITH